MFWCCLGIAPFIFAEFAVPLDIVKSGINVFRDGNHIALNIGGKVFGKFHTATAGQDIESDLGIDDSVFYSVSNEIVFVYNGTRWQLQYSGTSSNQELPTPVVVISDPVEDPVEDPVDDPVDDPIIVIDEDDDPYAKGFQVI